ncbi:hypothetical protein GALMADRAFT_455571 [Galerina marginata CBS 339.88]|uniref:Uncharacterized protein n=1 Tax=Galerina marginata (strain CBS 339.88) TaxID=685588 RepID=A0A067T136_GALM3|nr:hypothetical protein GALMADRAFT_455571 [Galerina marginata CBS 339.88]
MAHLRNSRIDNPAGVIKLVGRDRRARNTGFLILGSPHCRFLYLTIILNGYGWKKLVL